MGTHAGKGDDLEGSSVTWVMQTSFNPPLVVVAVKADSYLAQVIERHHAFAIYLLTKQQKVLAEAFTKPTTVGGGRIGGIAFQRTGDGGSTARRFQRVGRSEGDRCGAPR